MLMLVPVEMVVVVVVMLMLVPVEMVVRWWW